MSDSEKNEHAQALSGMGASKGGKARAQKLSKEQRKEIAREAAITRWAKPENPKEGLKIFPQASYGSPDHPLKLGEAEIPCYVLEKGERAQRLLVLGGMLKALDMSAGSAGRGLGSRLSRFIASKSIQPFVNDELKQKINKPILFRLPTGGLAYGFEASVLADICEVVLEARKQDKLNWQQDHIAKQCETLIRGWARVGLDALIDEVTGYQYRRSRNALELILDRFIAKELRAWTKTFSDDFYEQLFRLRGWTYSPFQIQKPQIIGHITNDIVYKRIGPMVLEELQRITPKDEKGRRKHKFFQRLSDEHGHPKLKEHLFATTALMKASPDWNTFYKMLNIALPKYNVTLPLPLDIEAVNEEEIGLK